MFLLFINNLMLYVRQYKEMIFSITKFSEEGYPTLLKLDILKEFLRGKFILIRKD